MPKHFVAISAIWLRRIGDEIQVLVETGGDWKVVIVEKTDAAFSHIAEANGAAHWRMDPITSSDSIIEIMNEKR
jgi:hypothetical protein